MIYFIAMIVFGVIVIAGSVYAYIDERNFDRYIKNLMEDK